MDFISTVKGSLLENFYPEGWDMKKIDECCEKGVGREDFWNKDFAPKACDNINDFDTFMGHEIALQIKKTRDDKQKLAIILPVGPMGMYKWAAYFLNEWDVKVSKTDSGIRMDLDTTSESRFEETIFMQLTRF